MELKSFFAQDVQGNVIPSPTVYLYQPGTTTAVDGLQDAAGGALTNPFTGSETGQIQVAAPGGDYDMRIVSGLRDYTMRVRFIDVTMVASAEAQVTAATAQAQLANEYAGNAAGSAAQALAIYGNTAAQQAAVTAAQNAASVAAGHAASASSVVQQDLSGVNAAALHRSPNAVTAMFVYDTSKDSDGGAWTEKCQHTSWYNEAINGKWLGAQASEAAARAVSGATTGDYFQLTTDGKFYKLNATSGTTEVFRGNKRDFPRLAGIVAEAGNVNIYDLTEPGRPMWMRFVRSGTTENYNQDWLWFGNTSNNASTGVAASSGILLIPQANRGVYYINFPSERVLRIGASGDVRAWLGLIAQRHTVQATPTSTVFGAIANQAVNAVAMTVLPDAPVDPVTGLQVPTIAVGTGGGLSIIRHNGTVYNITSNPSVVNFLSISGKTLYISGSFGSQSSFGFIKDIGAASLVNYFVSTGQDYAGYLAFNGYGGVRNTAAKGVVAVAAPIAYAGAPYALAFQKTNFSFPDGTGSKAAQGAFAKLTNSWNKGYSVGDERRAYLSDIDAGSVSDTELAPSLDAWTLFPAEATSISIVDGKLVVSNTRISGSVVASVNITGLTVGKTYKAGYTLEGFSGAGVSINFVTNGTIRGANGTFFDLFVATATSHTLRFQSRNAGGVSFTASEVSLKEVVADRSHKAATASITGTITKTAVASAAQLVAYSGFSASNYLREPYRADLDFGTGEWSVGAWVNKDGSAAGFGTTGPEFITNGTFDTDTNGWAASSGTITWDPAGRMSVNSTGRIYTDITGLTAGKTYIVKVNCISTSSSSITIRISDWWGANPARHYLSIPGAGQHVFAFKAVQAAYSFMFDAPGIALFDDVSIKEVSGAASIVSRQHASGPAISLGMDVLGGLTATANDGTTTRTVTTTAAYNTAAWLKAEATYRAGRLAILVNGVEVAVTHGTPLLTLNNSNAVLTIGNSYALDAPFPGSIALLKLSATVPTPEQSVWMYEQEKQLFRDGAQCCLPDSGAIVDLTYDDATDKWIAVSATNESEWSGLVRTSVTPVPAGSYTKAAAASGVQLLARSTTSPGVDVTIPAYGLREELVKRAESAARLNAQLAVFDYVGGFTASTTNGSTSITSVAGLTYPASYIGAQITGSGIPAGTVITGVSGTTIYLSAAATATATGVQISFTDFALPVGYEAKAVLSAGSVKTEGSTKDYTRLFDGFRESIRFGTAPGYQAAVQIQATRSAA